MLVDSPGFQKMPGILCTHCAPHKGCDIYETRPPICRNWFCAWRLSDLFDDSWRPDISGVLMTFVDKNIPESYVQEAVELLLIDIKTALAREELYQFIFNAVGKRVPLFLTLPGPPGHASAGVFLNTILEFPVNQNDEQTFRGIFGALVQTIAMRPFPKAVLTHGKF
jgi:hypothetical protein